MPGTNDIIGLVLTNASVSINSTTNGVYRRGQYYQKAISIDNSSAAQSLSVTVTATAGIASDTQTGTIFVPKTTEVFASDSDGNTSTNGRWIFTWDGENRLIRLAASTSIAPKQIDFDYDWLGRRIRKKVWNTTAGTGTPDLDRIFVYDGWNLIAICDANNHTNLLQSFCWGNDLSGTLQGAGGVAGLLWITDTQSGTAGTYFPAYDGNGSVVALAKASDGSIAAQYEYAAFGETIRASGLMAKANPFRFSTKYTDDESDFLYYGRRYYNYSSGRWISPDPLADDAFFATYQKQDYRKQHTNKRKEALGNCFGFVGNAPLTHYDAYGLSPNDVSSIQGAAVSAFFELCDSCKRCDNSWFPFINNDLQITFGAPYLACQDQALFAQEHIMPTLQNADDVWTPDVPRIFKPLPH